MPRPGGREALAHDMDKHGGVIRRHDDAIHTLEGTFQIDITEWIGYKDALEAPRIVKPGNAKRATKLPTQCTESNRGGMATAKSIHRRTVIGPHRVVRSTPRTIAARRPRTCHITNKPQPHAAVNTTYCVSVSSLSNPLTGATRKSIALCATPRRRWARNPAGSYNAATSA